MEIAKKAYFFTLDLLQTILLAASIFLVIYIFFFRPFQVSGESMHPTFVDKEYILTNLITLKFASPVKGDVIVFKAPTDKDKDFIKRVIGTEGDSVSVQDGFVYVNGQKLNESQYLATDVRTYGGSFLKDGEAVTVPLGQYIVFGDNRPFSSDSREWGFLEEKDIIGKSFFVYWPVNTMRVISNPYPNTK
ncbi:MAG: signal peptidase I [Candidatus Levybacteria bacterium]|nr:signal peptidase I [Candidatus Levybacteria bacterium]